MSARFALLGLFLGACGPDANRPKSPVLISEIMYHPVLEESLVDEHEFLEIHNRTGSPVALDGWQVAGSVKFTFPPGTGRA